VHPTLSLAKRKIDDLQREYDQAIKTEAEIVPGMLAQKSRVAIMAVATLKASLIEGVYTGVEGVLREILSVVDGGVPSSGESWHARLLAQATQPGAERSPIISEEVFYRHSLREDSVDENFELMKEVLPAFVAQGLTFIDQHGIEDVNGANNSPSP
jgi:hypothetical protein